ncbi:ROK family protein [Erwinia sp. HR93]|uniref:sugar metabolism global transcriptional regulator Mlc n=1 Tax=Erwinia sp. HR93 TaxID=3094840 RepID=UPI002ADEF963|nr:ROK family protein [Erwinia sp. HR93]MEA1065054.1 ROK family protein [Erwinia sp. HR93]
MVAESQPGHIDQIKQTNAGMVYHLIDTLGPVSRIDLSRFTQLAPASITKIVREMLDAHLVQETEIPESGARGRPATGLNVATAGWHYLAVRLGRGDIALALHDLSGAVVIAEIEALSPDIPEQASSLLSRIVRSIDNFFTRNQSMLERLTAVAITLPGIVDTGRGIVRRMPLYEGVHDMPLRATLEEHIGVSVFIQHDISAWTLAESMFGAAKGASDVIQLVIDDNVGAGVITDGRLLHAGSSSLVEIGHTQVDTYGRRCYCGNNGCLETIASVESILELARQRMSHSMRSLLHERPLSIASLCDAALNGDRLACDIISGVGTSVGRILAIMVNLFNPQKVLIGSPLNQAASILYPVIHDCVRRQALPAYSQDIQLVGTRFNNQGRMAAAALIKDALYNGTLLIRLLQG